MLAYIYIDDAPHTSPKMSRAFKAYETSNSIIEQVCALRSPYLNDYDLNNLIIFIREYIKAFVKTASGESFIRSFHFEFVRLLNYLLRFGLFIFRENKFQDEDVSMVFSYLCYMCDIFTGKSYIKSMHSLDKIISKDTILTDASRINPFQKAAYDVKFTLFNKNYSTNENFQKGYEEEENRSMSRSFHVKILREIVTVFHLFLDLRQNYLILNNIEFFYDEVFLKYKGIIERGLTSEENDETQKMLLTEFTHIIPDSHSFHNYLNYELLSIDVMYES